jgi:hypothetical protein
MWSFISFTKVLVTGRYLAVLHSTTCVDKSGPLIALVLSSKIFPLGFLEGETFVRKPGTPLGKT